MWDIRKRLDVWQFTLGLTALQAALVIIVLVILNPQPGPTTLLGWLP